ncbi:MAG: hypothetical protein JST75_19620 [Bacteroidetes bacterium]|nr:hypothetical protein [Bacteroidota bacterium]
MFKNALQKSVIIDDKAGGIYRTAVFLAFLFYFISCFGPLRLEFDSLRYFAIEDCLEFGCAVNSGAAKDFLPYGYPVLLLLLAKSGLLKTFFIAFVNGAYLLCSLFFVRKIMGPVNRYFLFFIFLLFHWTYIKLFAYPLSEMQYLFFSSGSLYCYFQFRKNKKWLLLFVSFILATLALLTRTIGIALIVALISAFIWDNRKIVISKQNRLLLFIGIALCITVSFFILMNTPELQHYASAFFKDGIGNTHMAALFATHFREWGQLILNIPIGKIENYFPVTMVGLFFLIAGILAFCWFIYALFRLRSFIPAIVTIYLVVYTLIIFNWPMYDPRFWMPVLPFIISVIMQAPVGDYKLKKLFTPLFVSIYIIAATFAFGYSLHNQFNKEAFARSQAKGVYRNEYEMHFFGKTLNDTARNVDAGVMKVLKRVD